MRMFNPAKKQFTYHAQNTAVVQGTTANIRVNIQGDAWFNLHALMGAITFAAGGAPTADLVYINIFDEGTGRNLLSTPVSLEALFTNVGRQTGLAAGAVGYAYRRPLYLATPFTFRPNSTVRIEINNRNIAGTGAAIVRIALIGLKVYDLNRPDESPGVSFHPFFYVADFATLAATTQTTVSVPIQQDADFDVTLITASWNLVNGAPYDVFMAIQEIGTGYQFEETALPLHLYAGGPHYPYIPIRPIRLRRTGGVNITLNNTTVAGITNSNIILHGYKVFK